MTTDSEASRPEGSVPPRRWYTLSKGFRWALGILLGLPVVFAAVFFWPGDLMYSRESRVKTDLRQLAAQLSTYQMVSGSYPTAERGLSALVTKPTVGPAPRQWFQYLTQLPKDPWGNDYVYLRPGRRNPKGFDLFSKGKDGIPDTPDDIIYEPK